MGLSEVRYIYWDGLQNVDAKSGAVDRSVTCWPFYREENPIEPADSRTNSLLTVNSAPEDLAKKDPKEQRQFISNCVVPSIKVRIAKVDSFFVPVTDLLAIELKLRLLKRIKALMLSVFNCNNVLIYQEVLDKDQILRLPKDVKDDKSPKEPAGKKDERRKARADKPVST